MVKIAEKKEEVEKKAHLVYIPRLYNMANVLRFNLLSTPVLH